MAIDPSEIERIKTTTDLVSFIASKGVLLTKNGRNHKGLCPFHQETSPSFTVNPSENLWHCFGCNAGGDVFNFVERMDKVGFVEAVKRVAGRQSLVAREGLSNTPRPWISAPGTPDVMSTANDPLRLRGGDQDSAPSKQTPTFSYLTANHQKLLNRVVQFYQQELFKDKRGLEYLKTRGITDRQSLADFGVGFVAGNLSDMLPADGDYEAALKQIGILNERGHEMFYGCVVFPLLDSNDNCVGLYGRRIDEDQVHPHTKKQSDVVCRDADLNPREALPAKQPRQFFGEGVKHLYLPGPRRGLVNRQAAKRSKTLFLTESIIDALSLYANGFKNVIPLYGVNGFTEDHEKLLRTHPPETVYLCFDSDEAGMRAGYAVKERIKTVASGQSLVAGRTARTQVHILKLPVKDANDFFRKYRADEFEKLVAAANPQSVEASDIHQLKGEKFYQETAHGFMVAYGKREYEVKGVAQQGTQLKATIKASTDIKGDGRFQITTIDLYSLRSREWFAKAVAELTGEREELCREDLCKILTRIEQKLGKPATKKETKTLNDAEEKEAYAFLKNPKLFDEILADLEELGCTGEETNKLVAYLAAVSRKMEDPLSLLIRSRSAAGKSTLQDAILSLVPEEDFIKYTRLSDQALFYKEPDSLVHKVLAIEEAAGLGGSAYSIRTLQSAKQLTVATTSKDPTTGKMKTEEYKVNGPLSIMLTTTTVDLDAEMESRFLTITIDESKKMTERIFSKQRDLDTLEGYLAKRNTEALVVKHQNAQRLLKPLAVVNPYAPHLSFPSDNLRTRRDHKKYLNLMKAIAFLHQYQRKVRQAHLGAVREVARAGETVSRIHPETISYIEVTLADIACANKLAHEVLGQSLDDLSPSSRTLLNLIHRMVTEKSAELNLSPQDPSTLRQNSGHASLRAGFSFNRRMLREYAKWSEWQVRLHITELEELGFVYSRMGSHGKEYVYELNPEAPNAPLALQGPLPSGQGPADPTRKVYLGLTEISQLEELNLNPSTSSGQAFEGGKGNFVG